MRASPFAVVFTLLFCALVGPNHARAQTSGWSASAHSPRALYSSTRVVARLRSGASIALDPGGRWVVSAPGLSAGSAEHQSLIALLNAQGLRHAAHAITVPIGDRPLAASLGLDRDVVLVLATPMDTGLFSAAIASFPSVFERAEPEAIGGPTGDDPVAAVPNDPLFALQYPLSNTGQMIQGGPGLAGADIAALPAWAAFAPRSEVIVAVLDSGVAAAHPDLLGRLTPGWNVVSNSPDTDDQISSHGTHVAGIIAATTGNGTGIAGICPTARIMPVKVTNAYGTTGASWTASGIVFAADNGARVLNISLGFDGSSELLRAAVQYAVGRGCVIACSAGNVPAWPVVAPARYPECIAVGATDNRDALTGFSATGPEIDLVAPGQDVLSTWHRLATPATYQYQSGTSQAAPIVAGVAALVLSADPSLSAQRTRAILEGSARDLETPGWDPRTGHGRVDAARALAQVVSARPHAGKPGSECPADLNFDGEVTPLDSLLYLNFYAAQSPRADFALPVGVLNGDDFFAFTAAYAMQCPK